MGESISSAITWIRDLGSNVITECDGIDQPMMWAQDHALAVVGPVVVIAISIVLVVLIVLIFRSKLKYTKKQLSVVSAEHVKNCTSYTALSLEKEVVERALKELSDYDDLKEEIGQLRDEEQMRRKRLVPVAKTALQEFFGADSWEDSKHIQGNVSDIERDYEETYLKDGAEKPKSFNVDDIAQMKEMMEKLGSKIIIGPADDGEALATAVAAEVSVKISDEITELKMLLETQLGDGSESIISSLETVTGKLVEQIENAPGSDINALVETALAKYHTRVCDDLVAIKAERSNIDVWTPAELIAEVDRQLEPVGQKIIIVEREVNSSVVKKLLSHDSEALMDALKVSVASTGVEPVFVSNDPSAGIGGVTDLVMILEKVEAMLRPEFFVYLSRKDDSRGFLNSEDLINIKQFKKQV